MATPIAADILAEISQILVDLDRHSPESVEQFIQLILQARCTFLLGAGRSGLVAKAFAMRLVHLGIPVHVAGETTTPSVQAGDLVIIVSASGTTASILAIADRIYRSGAEIVLITAACMAPLHERCRLAIRIPCPAAPAASPLLPLGSSFELSTFILLEAAVAQLAADLGVSAEAMRLRHSVLE